jgi:hypothetical protein
MQVLRGRGLRHRPADAFATPQEEEEAAYAIALSARNFSRRTQSLVDDKLSFSATLMRAGEIAEAGRAMAEFEEDVRGERAALLEQVGEVSATRAGRHGRGTRPRFAGLLATMLMGISLLSASLAAAAVAGLVADKFSGTPVGGPEMGGRVAQTASGDSVRIVEVAPGVKLVLNHRQFRTYRQLLSGAPVNAIQLEAFFEDLPPDLAAAVKRALAATGLLTTDQVEMIDLLIDDARAVKDKAKPDAEQETEAAGPEPTGDPQEPEAEQSESSDSGKKTGREGQPSDDGGTEASLPDPLLPLLPLP